MEVGATVEVAVVATEAVADVVEVVQAAVDLISLNFYGIEELMISPFSF